MTALIKPLPAKTTASRRRQRREAKMRSDDAGPVVAQIMRIQEELEMLFAVRARKPAQSLQRVDARIASNEARLEELEREFSVFEREAGF